MSIENSGVENNTASAPVQSGVEENNVAAPATSSDLDLVKVIADLDERLAKVSSERDNYKTGLLKAKGKIEEEFEGEETIDDKIQRGIKEAMLNTEIYKIQAEKDSQIRKMATELSEAKRVIANRPQAGASSVGGGVDKTAVSNAQFFSSAQVAELKAKGWNDEKIAKLIENAKRK